MRNLSHLMVVLLAALGHCFAQMPHPQPKAPLTPVTPCTTADRALPVTRECVAAAMAEEKFLDATRHLQKRYLILPMHHSPDDWRFMIELGDETQPPRLGAHWMVAVDRRTGRVTLTPGK
jgi:hypothetical protein